MDSNERIKEVCQKIIKVKTALQDLESSVDAVHLLLSADHSMWLLQSEFDDLKKKNEEFRSQLAALKIEHDELEKEHSDRGQYLAGKEKEIEELKTELRNNALFLQEELSKNAREIGELKEKTRYLGNDIFHWHSEMEKIISALNKSKKAFKSGIIAKAREQVEKIAKEMIVTMRTWSI